MGNGSKKRSMGDAVEVSAILVGVMFAIGVLTFLFNLPTRQFGIVPRTIPGLVGVAFSPLLHANYTHLTANAGPLFLLLMLLFADAAYRPVLALVMIWFVSGLGTWLIGRGGAIHLGASSLIYGLFMYLVVSGLLLRSWRSVLIAVMVFLLYGGIVYGVLPQDSRVSWEAHLCGALAGVSAALLLHKKRRSK
jgi:membrane associated rhomboid family serine protease